MNSAIFLNLAVRTNGLCSTTESVLENETHKLLWDFDVQMDHLILTRRLDLIIINKKGELA